MSAPESARKIEISCHPRVTAAMSGVYPRDVSHSSSAPSSTRSSTIFSWPSIQARTKGVVPSCFDSISISCPGSQFGFSNLYDFRVPPTFWFPLPYSTQIQDSASSWHFPVSQRNQQDTSKSDAATEEPPESCEWFCLQRRSVPEK